MTNYWHSRLQDYNISKPEGPNYKFQNLIDIIIPVYNDRMGLYATLFSINIFYKYHLIIVDDCSSELYDDIIDFFKQFFDITYVRTPKNGGPAIAKNYGVQFVTNKYLMFLDAGDTLLHSNVLPLCEQKLEESGFPVANCAAYEEYSSNNELELIPADTNLWIGKIYDYHFYKNYNLHFIEESSFCNDDIGMNMLVSLILGHENILRIDEPMLIWHSNSDSVSRKDSDKYNFADGNLGTAKSAIYAIDNAEHFGVSKVKIEELACSLLCNMYYTYLSCIALKPEYKNQCFDGAKYFYDSYWKKHKDEIPMSMLIDFYNMTTEDRYKSEQGWQPYLSILPTYSFIDFITNLDN